MNALITSLIRAGFDPERIMPGVPLAQYTTFRVGGPADVMVHIASEQEVAITLRAAHDASVPVTVIGNGSNLVVRDGGIRGLVMHMGQNFSAITREGDIIRAQAGATMAAVARFAQREGLDGLCEIAGIPGTIGGGAIMNAGAYGGELAQTVIRVDAIATRDGGARKYEGKALGFAYRRSAMMDAGVIITGVTMQLRPGDPDAIAARTGELARARRENQPLEYPSAGSTFKRPEGLFAAKLIDDAGLRGLRVGDAQVSEKHAGFIVNLGSATASDILALMDEVKRRVLDLYGVALEPEVRILGEDAPLRP